MLACAQASRRGCRTNRSRTGARFRRPAPGRRARENRSVGVRWPSGPLRGRRRFGFRRTRSRGRVGGRDGAGRVRPRGLGRRRLPIGHRTWSLGPDAAARARSRQVDDLVVDRGLGGQLRGRGGRRNTIDPPIHHDVGPAGFAGTGPGRGRSRAGDHRRVGTFGRRIRRSSITEDQRRRSDDGSGAPPLERERRQSGLREQERATRRRGLVRRAAPVVRSEAEPPLPLARNRIGRPNRHTAVLAVGTSKPKSALRHDEVLAWSRRAWIAPTERQPPPRARLRRARRRSRRTRNRVLPDVVRRARLIFGHARIIASDDRAERATATPAQTPSPRSRRGRGRENRNPGDDLFSRKAALSVSSALESLTSVFGMGTGVASPLASPGFLIVMT